MGIGKTNAVGSGGLSMELLWENASPTSSFADQMLSFDLNNGDFVVVKYKATATGTIQGFSSYIALDGAPNVITYPTTSGVIQRRNINATKNGITFEMGYTGNTADNNMMIPLEIYGIKGVS